MRKTLQLLGVATLVLLVSTAALAASRGVEFDRTGFIEDPFSGEYFPATLVLGITDNGGLLLTSPTPYGNYVTLTTTDTYEWTLIGSVAGSPSLSADGSAVMAGVYNSDGNYNSAIWNGAEDDWTLLDPPVGAEPCGSSFFSHFGMGGNADHSTGLTWEGCSYARAYKWDAVSNVAVDLDSMNGDSSRGNDISDDGNVIGGWTRTLCGSWRGAKYVGGEWDWVDGLGTLQRKICASDSSACCGDSDCPEYEQGTCDRQCIDGLCGPGPTEGEPCTQYWNCSGVCDGGATPGADCQYSCPSLGAGSCMDNPTWDEMIMLDYRGEVYDVSKDGNFILGEFYGQNPYHWSDPLYDTFENAAYITGPGGDVRVPPPEGANPNFNWVPFQVSDDGSVVVGRFGGRDGWSSVWYPVLWTEETGTLDFQWFLVGQGLDELWSWYLTDLTTVTGDGTIVGGHGYDPPGSCLTPWGGTQCLEGYTVDISKAKICHKPGTPAERTLGIGWDSIDEHLAHGDILATCEFAAGGVHSRERFAAIRPPARDGAPVQTPETDNRAFTPDTYSGVRALLNLPGPSAEATSPEADSKAPAPRRELPETKRIAPKRVR